MKHYIKLMALFAFLLGISQKGMTQSPCFPNLPVTGAYADPATSSSPNAERIFWLTWGSTYAESIDGFPYGKPGVRVFLGTKSYGSIDLGGDRYMCIEAEITLLNVSGTQFQEVESYIPGTYNVDANNGDFLVDLYNIGGSGGANGNPNNRMASGLKPLYTNRVIDIVIKIKATTGGKAVRLRGMVLADAESLGSSSYIIASGDGNWSVAEVKKNVGQGNYNIRKENNQSGTQSIVFARGNNKRTGAIAFLTFDNSAYDSEANDYAVTFSSQFNRENAIAIGLLTSGYDFGDAPESYGKPIHLIDDIELGNDNIVPDDITINVNTPAYTPAGLTYDKKRYLGSTAPDADFDDMYSLDALGDDINPIGSPTLNEEDAWPVIYRQFADKNYEPSDVISAVIPYKKGKAGDKISGWIDFNLNGTFDVNERKTVTIPSGGAGNGTVTLEWIVPATRVAYSTYVRLRYFGPSDDATRVTGTALHGEVEDHRIYILTPAVSNPTINSKAPK